MRKRFIILSSYFKKEYIKNLMTNDVINTAEEQIESQTSTVESNNNQTFDAGAATEDKQVSTETADNNPDADAENSTETSTAQQPAETVNAEEGAKTEPVNAEETAKNEPAPAQETGQSAAESKPASSPEVSGEVDFGSILEQYEQEQTAYHTGDVVQGKVVDISDRGVLVDFGYKSEGIVPLEEFSTAGGEVTVKKGDEVEVIIKNISSNDAPPILSYSDVRNRVAWDAIEKAYNNGEPVIGHITDKTKGGLKVDVQGVEAFLPGSQVDSRPIGNLDDFVGKDIEAKVIRFSRKRNNIVLSRKVITDELINEKKVETLNGIEEGYIVEGTITNLTEYGAFVDIGGIDGLLHVTDMTWGRSQNPNDFFKVGENVQVKILKLDRDKEKISLGYKQLLPDPWGTVEELYPISTRVKGKISSVTDYGAFVELEPGVEGLIHISEMSWSKRIKHPKNLVRKNDEVEVQILDIDTGERRISLGIKQLQPNPWDTVGERFQVGDKVRGRVRNLTDFGAFVEIEDGIEGLVHVSDITWSKKVKHPKDVLSKGQDIDAVITRLSPENRKISLSIKELTPSAWEAFVATHKPGDVVHGKISRFANFGVFVELADELEGLCHISELSDERINDPEDQFKIGQELDFKILRIEPDTQKIGLSHRAVGKESEPQIDTKIYSTEAKGGMASLGELANLRFGRAEEEKPAPVEAETESENQPTAEQPEPEESAQAVTAETPAEAETSEITDQPEEAVAETVDVSETEQPSEEATESVQTEETTQLSESAEVESAEAETAETAETETASQTSAESEETGTAETSDLSEVTAENTVEEDENPAAESEVSSQTETTDETAQADDADTGEQAEEKTAQS
jgi:small subunit ribosomal protein S1